MDYDHDGVNDLLVNCPDTPYKGIWFFRNIGTNEDPLFDRAQRLCKKASQNICSSFVGDSVCIIDAGKALPDFFNSWFEKPEKIRFSDRKSRPDLPLILQGPRRVIPTTGRYTTSQRTVPDTSVSGNQTHALSLPDFLTPGGDMYPEKSEKIAGYWFL